MNETLAQRLAALADHQAMTAEGVARFPDLLKRVRIKPADLTLDVITHAESLNRAVVRDCVRRVNELNSKKSGRTTSVRSDNSEVVIPNSSKAGDTKMKISTRQAIALLTVAGLKGADKFDNARITKRVNGLLDLLTPAAVEEVEEEKVKTLATEVLDFLKTGGTVEVLETKPEAKPAKAPKTEKPAAEAKEPKTEKPENKKKAKPAAETEAPAPAPAKKGKAVKPEAKPAKATKETETVPVHKKKTKKTEGGAKDWYGSREGTQTALINAECGKKEFTPEQIHEALGGDKVMRLNRIKDHLRTLHTKGFLERTQKGYKRTAKVAD